MKKKIVKKDKLNLNRETLRTLESREIEAMAGGATAGCGSAQSACGSACQEFSCNTCDSYRACQSLYC
jgi:hypothetical protein